MSGVPQQVLEDVNIPGLLASANFDVSQDGTLVYLRGERPQSIFWLDSQGVIQPLHSVPGLYLNPRFSPDGRRLAFAMGKKLLEVDLWVKDLDSGTASRVTHFTGVNHHPVWTPDGANLVFESVAGESVAIYWVRADGVGEARRLTDDKLRRFPLSFTPDGKRLVLSQGRESWTVPVEGDGEHPRLGTPEPFLRESLLGMSFSPDGHWVANSSDPTGTWEVYVRPFPGPGAKRLISSGGGVYPIWSRTRKELFFKTLDGRTMVADYTVNGDSFVAGRARVWSEKRVAWALTFVSDLAPDGKRFAVVLYADGTAESLTHLNVLLNFFNDLRQRVR
jgi:serine/threonine-protein kinase